MFRPIYAPRGLSTFAGSYRLFSTSIRCLGDGKDRSLIDLLNAATAADKSRSRLESLGTNRLPFENSPVSALKPSRMEDDLLSSDKVKEAMGGYQINMIPRTGAMAGRSVPVEGPVGLQSAEP